jgi:hypothetical protein
MEWVGGAPWRVRCVLCAMYEYCTIKSSDWRERHEFLLYDHAVVGEPFFPRVFSPARTRHRGYEPIPRQKMMRHGGKVGSDQCA